MRTKNIIHNKCIEEISDEYFNARLIFPEFHSNHEAYAIIKEEVDELWNEIKKSLPINNKIYNEAKQVAAMAFGLMYEMRMKNRII